MIEIFWFQEVDLEPIIREVSPLSPLLTSTQRWPNDSYLPSYQAEPLEQIVQSGGVRIYECICRAMFRRF